MFPEGACFKPGCFSFSLELLFVEFGDAEEPVGIASGGASDLLTGVMRGDAGTGVTGVGGGVTGGVSSRLNVDDSSDFWARKKLSPDQQSPSSAIRKAFAPAF